MFKVNNLLTNSYNLSPSYVKNIIATIYSYWSNSYKYGKIFENWRKFLKESQYFSKEQLESYQKENLKSLLKFINKNCEYYRNIIKDKNIDIENENVFSEIKKFPILNKDILRLNYNGIKTSYGKDDKLVFSTSGTTGTSLHVPVTQEALEREYAFKWQYQSVANAKSGDKFAYFTGHPVISIETCKPPFWIKNYYENSILFSIYHLSQKNIEDYVNAFNKFEPKYITGYPSGFYTFVNLAKYNGLIVKPVKAIFSASEVLHDYQKKLVEDYLKTQIFKWYGQVELTINIHECENRKMHVKEEYGFLELLKDDGTEVVPGEYGEAIGTGFGNKGFPLIRYNTGDILKLAKEQSCECGRGGRIIEDVLGRDEDVIVTPSGKIIGRLDFIFKPIENVKESQIVQEDLKNIRIFVVVLGSYTKKDEELIIKKAKERLGTEMNIIVEKTDKIQRGKNGKIRYVISKIKKKYDENKIIN
jgi:phenylacetate-CoA ligase